MNDDEIEQKSVSYTMVHRPASGTLQDSLTPGATMKKTSVAEGKGCVSELGVWKSCLLDFDHKEKRQAKMGDGTRSQPLCFLSHHFLHEVVSTKHSHGVYMHIACGVRATIGVFG